MWYSFGKPVDLTCQRCGGLEMAMEDHHVVPDVLDAEPAAMAEVKYGDTEISNGNLLSPNEAQDTPTVSWPVEDDTMYTLCMTDPDAPSRKNPKYREWQHWLVVNIPGTDVDQGETLTQYIGPEPPRNTGLHRYVFAVFKQGGHLNCDEPRLKTTAAHRGCYSTKNFAEKYNLELVAGNFFQAQHDD